MVGELHIGVLALQGAFRDHCAALERCGARVTQVRRPLSSSPLAGLEQFDGLVLPGGESTTMGRLRQKIDIVLVLVSVAITLIFGVEWTLREGTIIAALIFGPMMDFWKKTVFSGKSA